MPTARYNGDSNKPIYHRVPPMRLRVLSDLHLESFDHPADVAIHDDVDCDVVVLAGDIAQGMDGLE